jgi:serine/threonine-protein kinase
MPDLSGGSVRYQLVGEVARGGMGAILEGRDVDLGRDLAIKVILEEHRDVPEIVRRFVEEAQIGGQLQHPGIVPVYELGRFPDGRLYIAMKLVRGRTLAALLESRRSPSDDRPRFISIFEQVCQTMAYAHSRGVVHRDLKPSNVMVGSFGEVQVMDWGLAKVLDQGGVADELKARRRRDDGTAIRTIRARSLDDESHAGSVLGTPAYMSPEQARGELDTVDERADVFGLGSILCEILSGQPPYVGKTGADVHRMAQRADLEDASNRLAECGAEAELIALAKSCLAPAPKDRPRDAGVILAALSAHLAGAESRLREASLAQARAETLAAGERKRRILAVALAASVLVIGVLGAGGWVWVSRERLRTAEAVGIDVSSALNDALRNVDLARMTAGDDPTPWVRAIEAARRAEALAARGEASEELRNRVRTVVAGIERERAVAEAAEKDRRMVERLAGVHNDLGVHQDWQKADAEYAAAFRGYGVDLDELDPEEAGVTLAASPVAPELANALDQWAFLRRGPWLRNSAGAKRLVAVAKAADPDPWRNRLRDTLSQPKADPNRKLDTLERLAATADPDRLPEASVTRLAFDLAWLGRREKAIALLRRTQRAHPDDFWVNTDLGRELMHSGQPEEAVRFFGVAVGIRPRSEFALSSLGKGLSQSGQVMEAADTFRRLIATRPDDAHAHVLLGAVLLKMGGVQEAEVHFDKARRLKPNDWMVSDVIASARADSGNWEGAIRDRREAVHQKPSFAFAHNALGFTLLGAGRADEAAQAFREALRKDPRLPPARVGLARALIARGEFVAAQQAIGRDEHGMPPHDHDLDPAAVLGQAERMIALEARLPGLLCGESRPADAREAAEFAQLCFCKQQDAASARLWSEAFASRPALVDEPGREYRHQAARAAALAASGRSKHEPDAEPAARKRLRRQALDWLHAELKAVAGLVENGPLRERVMLPTRLGRWKIDPALAGVRDPEEIVSLAEDERREIQDFWSAVDSLLEQARTSIAQTTLPRSL